MRAARDSDETHGSTHRLPSSCLSILVSLWFRNPPGGAETGGTKESNQTTGGAPGGAVGGADEMEPQRRCYYRVVSHDQGALRVQFGFVQRTNALIDVSMERWSVLSHRLRKDGFRLVRCRPETFATQMPHT